jgi:hypothetical protein
MPNPIDNPSYYDTILVGSRRVPGILTDIQGLVSAEEWVKQSGLTNIEALIWRKRPLIKGIKVVCCLNGETDEDTIANYTAHYAFIAYIKPGGDPNKKPPAYTVTNSQFKGAFVKQIVYAGHEEPIFRLNASIVVTYVFDEYRKPTPIPIGPPEPAKTSETNPTPKTQQEADLVMWLQKAQEGNPQ